VLALWDGATLGRCLPQTIPIFVGNTHPDRDIEREGTRPQGTVRRLFRTHPVYMSSFCSSPQVRMRFFTLLGKLLSRSDTTLNVEHGLPAFAKTIVSH
jgi:hypothetical protein